MFCNCNFHFFRGSYYTYYSGPEDGIILKYCTFKEYKFVDDTRLVWRELIQNRIRE